MDEMCVWSEVARGILPQRYTVRLAWQGAGLIVTSPGEERVAGIDRFELDKLCPAEAVELIEKRLRRRESHLEAAFG
jgi:hypothetical protein